MEYIQIDSKALNGNRNNKGHDADPCDIISHLPVLSIRGDISHIRKPFFSVEIDYFTRPFRGLSKLSILVEEMASWEFSASFERRPSTWPPFPNDDDLGFGDEPVKGFSSLRLLRNKGFSTLGSTA